MTKHTEQCKADQKSYAARVKEYETKWPGYCRTCGGSGVTGYYDDPIGERWSSSQWFTEPCDCIETGFCPRCGKEAWVEKELETQDQWVCPHCGWDSENPDYLDEGPECDCWEREELY